MLGLTFCLRFTLGSTLGLVITFGSVFTISTSLDLTSGLSLSFACSPSILIFKLSTTDNILNGKPCDVLYTGYLNKDISFGDIVYFEPKNVQYEKLVIGTIGQLKVSLVDGDANEILSNFKISIVLHIV